MTEDQKNYDHLREIIQLELSGIRKEIQDAVAIMQGLRNDYDEKIKGLVGDHVKLDKDFTEFRAQVRTWGLVATLIWAGALALIKLL